jgi:hypothetical protein
MCDLDGQVLIDFGLGCNSTLPEDKAVDLYVLERACVAMHSSVSMLLIRNIHISLYWPRNYLKECNVWPLNVPVGFYRTDSY